MRRLIDSGILVGLMLISFIAGHLFTVVSMVYADPIEVKSVQVKEEGE